MRSGLLIGALILAVAASAVAVVYSTHQSRKAFVALQELQRERDTLNVEWGRLRIEQGTMATHGRIERIARERLGMRMPERDDIVIIRATRATGEARH